MYISVILFFLFDICVNKRIIITTNRFKLILYIFIVFVCSSFINLASLESVSIFYINLLVLFYIVLRINNYKLKTLQFLIIYIFLINFDFFKNYFSSNVL